MRNRPRNTVSDGVSSARQPTRARSTAVAHVLWRRTGERGAGDAAGLGQVAVGGGEGLAGLARGEAGAAGGVPAGAVGGPMRGLRRWRWRWTIPLCCYRERAPMV